MKPDLFKKVLIISILLIIIGFIIYYIVKYISYKDYLSKLKFPPWPSKCPDYWKTE